MTLLASSAVLGLAWFAAINLVVSGVVWLVVRALHGRAVAPRAGLWLTLRLFPAAASTLFVIGVFLPAHWRYELPGTPESFGIVLNALAAVAAVLVVRSAWRIAVVMRASYQVRSLIGVSAVPGVVRAVELDGVAVLCVAGIFRTTILLGRAVRDALTASELDVALAHEVAHRKSLDNIKRFAMYGAPDLFGFSVACRRLEAEWRGQVEAEADARAAQGDAARALNLASALVKVARLSVAAPRITCAPVWTAFYDESLFEVRVRRLVTGTCDALEPSPEPALAATFLIAACGITWLAALPPTIYRATEALARFLP